MKEIIKNYLIHKSELPKIIVIYGPTGSGKTSMSIKIAQDLETEIISTDSRQIFQHMNIWTGKITEDEKQWIKHHMLDIISPDNEYSVWEFKSRADKIISDLHEEWKIPILCGGTGLYIDSLIYNFNIPKVPADDILRKELEQEAVKYGNQYVYNKLLELDPEYAKELHPNNLRYVIRALEVKILTGKSKTEFREEKISKYDILFLTPYNGERELLYNRINTRVKMMFNEWLVEEVKVLLQTYKKTDFGMKTIGYKEVVEYLEWKMTWEDCIELVQKNNRNYAKKQLTWFRKYENKSL